MSSAPATPLRATYRVQLRGGLDLRGVESLIPALDRLGVSHLYLSPITRACSGSLHGYDVVDHGAIDPALGSEADLASLAGALSTRGMGLILDHVPNHGCVHPSENPWWRDVLEWGQASPWAEHFDVDWDAPEGAGPGRLLVPVLGAPYGEVLEAGELELALDRESARVEVHYHEWRFPLSPPTATRALARALRGRPTGRDPTEAVGAELSAALDEARTAAEAGARDRFARARDHLHSLLAARSDLATWVDRRLRALYASGGGRTARARLHALLEGQVYRLSWWQRGDQSLDYRRFFDVSELAGLRVERPEVFEAVHAGVLRWISNGWVCGLRIDHVDGLRDPRGYLEELRRHADRPIHVFVEKILEGDESLPPDWPVDGTTGYEFLADVGGLLVDPAGESTLDALDRECSGRRLPFPALLRETKREVVRRVLGSELHRLTRDFGLIATEDRTLRDWARPAIENAIAEVLVGLPVYRTYVRDGTCSPADRDAVARALASARNQLPERDFPLLEAIGSLLIPDRPVAARAAPPARAHLEGPDADRFRARFQQASGAVMAKGLEDTAFFRFHRLVGLNEVGGNPERFGLSVEAFHRRIEERAQRWPRALLATATHDTKWGEDTRARLAVLSEVAEDWADRVRGWRSGNDRARAVPGGAPCGGHELLLYQALLGTWPADWIEREPDAAERREYRERLEGFLRKAVREGKQCSSWRAPDEAYESGLVAFLDALLDPDRSAPFLRDFGAFVGSIAPAAAQHGLAQTVLKLTAPGVPDLYQGSERWQLALTDPDNRHPVPWQRLCDELAGLEEMDGRPHGERLAALSERVRDWPDARLKTWVVRALLRARRADPAVFAEGGYAPASVLGEDADRVIAFVRARAGRAILVAVPVRVRPSVSSLPFGFAAGAGSGLRVRPPDAWSSRRWQSLLGDGEVVEEAGSSGLPIASLWRTLPVAVFSTGGSGDPRP